jgi:hypothetical protein
MVPPIGALHDHPVLVGTGVLLMKQKEKVGRVFAVDDPLKAPPLIESRVEHSEVSRFRLVDASNQGSPRLLPGKGKAIVAPEAGRFFILGRHRRLSACRRSIGRTRLRPIGGRIPITGSLLRSASVLGGGIVLGRSKRVVLKKRIVLSGSKKTHRSGLLGEEEGTVATRRAPVYPDTGAVADDGFPFSAVRLSRSPYTDPYR